MNETRRLAAILAADVAGYSRLMGEDEAGTARAVREHREAARTIIGGHRGRIVKTTGDGLLAEFPSIVAAVECAIHIQQQMGERNAGVPEARRILYRIGVELGDVLIDGEDILGEGVNIAARLEGLAEAGGVCISGSAYDHVRGRIEADFVDLGEKTLKNIVQPVRVYALRGGDVARARASTPTRPAVAARPTAPAVLGIAALLMVIVAGGWYWLIANRPAAVATGPPAPTSAAAPAASKHLSIVVLPFTNLSGDPSQDYFTDGVTENLTTDLSRIRNSFVIARNTAFTYKGKSIDAREIGKELGVRYVLEGSVQRDQNRVRVNAQLIDAETGAHLWADRFEEDLADLFKLQDEVVARLARSLDLALTKAEAEKGARSNNPDVIDLSLQGWTLIWRGFQQPVRERRESVYQARRLFDEALKIDPDDADALAGSAYTYCHDYVQGWSDVPTDYEAKVLGQVNRAIARDPDNVRAYFVKAIYLSTSGRPGDAIGVADAGLAVNPNFAPLFSPRINAENSLGRFEQAKGDAERAMMRLSRRDPYMARFQVEIGDAELSLGHFEAAIDEYHKAIDAGFNAFYAYSNLSAAYAHAGKMDEAKAALAEARRLNTNLTVKWMIEHMPNLPAVFDGVRKAGLAEE